MSGGSVTGNAPNYGGSSTLRYSDAVTFQRGMEWSSTSNPGSPVSVTVESGATLNLSGGAPSVYRELQGNLSVASGATLTMDAPGYEMTAPLRVWGNVTANGFLELSSVSGGYLIVDGDFNGSENFIANGASVRFVGSALQQINGGPDFISWRSTIAMVFRSTLP